MLFLLLLLTTLCAATQIHLHMPSAAQSCWRFTGDAMPMTQRRTFELSSAEGQTVIFECRFQFDPVHPNNYPDDDQSEVSTWSNAGLGSSQTSSSMSSFGAWNSPGDDSVLNAHIRTPSAEAALRDQSTEWTPLGTCKMLVQSDTLGKFKEIGLAQFRLRKDQGGRGHAQFIASCLGRTGSVPIPQAWNGRSGQTHRQTLVNEKPVEREEWQFLQTSEVVMDPGHSDYYLHVTRLVDYRLKMPYMHKRWPVGPWFVRERLLALAMMLSRECGGQGAVALRGNGEEAEFWLGHMTFYDQFNFGHGLAYTPPVSIPFRTHMMKYMQGLREVQQHGRHRNGAEAVPEFEAVTFPAKSLV